MTYFEKFKQLNPKGAAIDSFDITEVKRVLNLTYDWSFLPNSALDVINRYNLNTVDVVDMLYTYKFIAPEELIDMMTYATSLPFMHLSQKYKNDYGKKHETTRDVLVYRCLNGVDNTAFTNIENLSSEAELNIEFPGRGMKVFYIIPTNYKRSANSLYDVTLEWNYYILFSRYMQYCLDNRASDMHFDVIHKGKTEIYRAMCRIGPDREECTLFKLDSRMNKDLIRETIKSRSSNQQAGVDLDAGVGVVTTLSDIFGDGTIEVRFTAERVLGGYYCVCRIHEQKNVSMGIDDLGFDNEIVKALKNATEKPSGLTIFTGKLRTGKNTSMSALANYISARDSQPSIMALDDPIEIVSSYPQMDYRGNIDLLKSGVRLAKKLDLDFLTLNEIPNAEVAFGVRDSVNSSIHTITTWHMNRIWHLPHKLFEYFGDSYRDIISQINLVCNQRLYKRQCDECQKEIHREDYSQYGTNPDLRIYTFFKNQEVYSSMVAQGCKKCGYSGYLKGHIVVLPEILQFTQGLVLKLFKAERPYEMEVVLADNVIGSAFSLEKQMCKALADGRLSSKDVLSIV